MEISGRQFSIGPNPVADQLKITGYRSAIKTKIVSITGEVMLSQEMNVPGELDVSFLPAGIYTVILSDEKGKSQITKLIRAAH